MFKNLGGNAPPTLDNSDAASIIDSMVELTRKQREIELRTSEILRVARPILIADGFRGLSMDRLAFQMEYAKGTIYNHFKNKEEIVLALVAESMEIRRSLFEQSGIIQGPARLRMMALGVACEFYTQHCTDDFAMEQWVRQQGIWDKSSEKRQNLIRQCEEQCMGIVAGIVRDAVLRQELVLPESLGAEELVFGFWAINYGSQVLSHTSPSLPSLGISNPASVIRIHCCTLLNGFQWNPVMDYARSNQESEALAEKLFPVFWTIKNRNRA
jgi:AcrR family transcriptional regulator